MTGFLMEGIGYTSALLLAGVFAWAGAAKLTDRASTRRSFIGLGLPSSFAVAVPVAELALAIALVLVPGWAAVAALALLAAFTTVLAGALRRGIEVGCGCFGTSRHDQVSFVELVRNGMLAVGAAAALGASRPVTPDVDELVLVTVAAALGCLVLALLQLRRRTGGIVRLDLPPA